MNAFDYVFPVIANNPAADKPLGPLSVVAVCGTAFSIGGGLFLTAEHVLAAATSHPDIRLGWEADGVMNGTVVHEHEAIPNHDIALLRSHVSRARALRWDGTEMPLLDDIQAVGFPYALEPTTKAFTMRAFKGYIVSKGPFHRLPSRPASYELSFQAPRGLSGAPVWAHADPPVVKGVVLGNQGTEMLVFSSRERVAEDRETVVERFEAMQTGIAIQASAILGVRSRLCSGTLEDHLRRQGLL